MKIENANVVVGSYRQPYVFLKTFQIKFTYNNEEYIAGMHYYFQENAWEIGRITRKKEFHYNIMEQFFENDEQKNETMIALIESCRVPISMLIGGFQKNKEMEV